MKVIDYLRGWLAAAIAYVIAERVSTLVTGAAVTRGGLDADWLTGSVYTPWLLPAALSAIAAIIAVRRKVTAAWWKWLILTITVPTAGGALLASWALDRQVDLVEVLPSVIVHVVLAGVLGVTVGTIVSHVRSAARTLRR